MEYKKKRNIVFLSSISGYISYYLGKHISDALFDGFWIKCVIRVLIFALFVALLYLYYARQNKE